jgi:DNA-binding beta-propeller fold protein YncE
VLVLGYRSVTQINGVTQTVERSYAVQPSDGDSGDGVDQGVAFAMTSHGLTAYVIVNGGVVPIDLATHTVGQLISIGMSPINAIAASPDGATVYVASGPQSENASGEITPIDTQANQAGQPITVGMLPDSIAFAPDGKTAYVADNENGDVVPINVTTGTAGQAILMPAQGGTSASIVFTPDGTTAYLGIVGGQVTPIDVAKGVAEAPIPGSYSSMAIAPDGKTLYIFGAGHQVTRVNTATNSLDAPLTTSAANDADELLMSPDGKSLYLLNGAGVLTVISTETGAVGKPISTSSGDYPRNMAITPDGKTLYITEHKDLVPFNTESQAVGKPIRLSDFPEFYGGLVVAGTAPALPLSQNWSSTSRCACARVSSADPAAWSGTCVSNSLTARSSKGRALSTRPSALAETRAPNSSS